MGTTTGQPIPLLDRDWTSFWNNPMRSAFRNSIFLDPVPCAASPILQFWIFIALPSALVKVLEWALRDFGTTANQSKSPNWSTSMCVLHWTCMTLTPSLKRVGLQCQSPDTYRLLICVYSQPLSLRHEYRGCKNDLGGFYIAFPEHPLHSWSCPRSSALLFTDIQPHR